MIRRSHGVLVHRRLGFKSSARRLQRVQRVHFKISEGDSQAVQRKVQRKIFQWVQGGVQWRDTSSTIRHRWIPKSVQRRVQWSVLKWVQREVLWKKIPKDVQKVVQWRVAQNVQQEVKNSKSTMNDELFTVRFQFSEESPPFKNVQRVVQ